MDKIMHENVFRNKRVKGTENPFGLEIRFLMTDPPINW
jgi:hypothetical protein